MVDLFSSEEVKEIKIALLSLQKIIALQNDIDLDVTINNSYNADIKNNIDQSTLHVSVCIDLIYREESNNSELSEYLVATLDNGKLRITIDGSPKHARPHIHIGHKQNHHSVSIAINDGEIMVSTPKDIPKPIQEKVSVWVIENRVLLNKIWRCIQVWGKNADADKRKNKLPPIL